MTLRSEYDNRANAKRESISAAVATYNPIHRPRNAFTLVELLVVIAIISLLAGMLLPALEQAIGMSRKVACQGRLKQAMIYVQMYEGEYEVILPSGIGSGTPGPSGFLLGQLLMYDAGYLPETDLRTSSTDNFADLAEKSILICPCAQQHDGIPITGTPNATYPALSSAWDSNYGRMCWPLWILPESKKNLWVYYSYGINAHMSGTLGPVPPDIKARFPSWVYWNYPLRTIKENASERLYFLEAANHMQVVRGSYLVKEYSNYRFFPVPHLDTANFSYYDGHVDSLERDIYQLGWLEGYTADTIVAKLPWYTSGSQW